MNDCDKDTPLKSGHFEWGVELECPECGRQVTRISITHAFESTRQVILSCGCNVPYEPMREYMEAYSKIMRGETWN